MSTPSVTRKGANSEGKSRSGYRRNLNRIFDLIVVSLLTSFMVVSFISTKHRTLKKLGHQRRKNFEKRHRQTNRKIHAVATGQRQQRKAGQNLKTNPNGGQIGSNFKHEQHPKDRKNHKKHAKGKKINRHYGKNYTTVDHFLAAYNGTKNLLLPRPIILLGLPKAGTTSIANFFRCNDLYVSHNLCKRHPIEEEKADLCSKMMMKNLKNNQPIFQNTGYFHVYAQFEHIDDCFFPQMTHLADIHDQYPHATFILNTRNVENWLNSTRHWKATREEDMSARLNKCDYPFDVVSSDNTTDRRLKDVFLRQAANARDFARRHPSHSFVEVAIDDERAGDVLGEAFFGVKDSERGDGKTCWNVHNANTEQKSRAWEKIRKKRKEKIADMMKKKQNKKNLKGAASSRGQMTK